MPFGAEGLDSAAGQSRSVSSFWVAMINHTLYLRSKSAWASCLELDCKCSMLEALARRLPYLVPYNDTDDLCSAFSTSRSTVCVQVKEPTKHEAGWRKSLGAARGQSRYLAHLLFFLKRMQRPRGR